MYQWYIQGTNGAPPEASYYYVEADGPNPANPEEPYTYRIRTLRHINASTQYRSVLTLTQTMPDGSRVDIATDTRLPGTSRDFALDPASDYRLDDDRYGYRFAWVDRGRWQAARVTEEG